MSFTYFPINEGCKWFIRMAYLLASESGRVAKSDPSPAHLLGAKFMKASALLRGSVQKVQGSWFFTVRHRNGISVWEPCRRGQCHASLRTLMQVDAGLIFGHTVQGCIKANNSLLSE